MSVEAVGGIEVENLLLTPATEEYSYVEALAERAYALWSWAYGITVGTACQVVHLTRGAIGAAARDCFFFPLKWSVIAEMKAVREQIEIEERYARAFWDPAQPIDRNLHYHAKIREAFNAPQDRVFALSSHEGVEITCRVIETKASGASYYNFVQVPGLYGTISNNIGALHPYLSAYLRAQEEGQQLLPARFVILSTHDLNTKPTTLEKTGGYVAEALKVLRREFGAIDQLVANSLGSVFVANGLKQVEDLGVLPRHLCLDRGPTSLWEVSKKYCWGLGRLIYPLVVFGRWGFDVEGDVKQFWERWRDHPERPSLLVTGVIKDHHFSGAANLCLGEVANGLAGVEVVVFDPPLQIVHQHAHHNLRADLLNTRYVVQGEAFMEEGEALPDAILRHSLCERGF